MKKIAIVAVVLAVSIGAHAVIASTYSGQTQINVSDEGVVEIQGDNAVYLVLARDRAEVLDVQMPFGVDAKAEFNVPEGATMRYDLYELVPIGTYGPGGLAKPCHPDPDKPDCTPTRWPPKLTTRLKLFRNFLGLQN